MRSALLSLIVFFGPIAFAQQNQNLPPIPPATTESPRPKIGLVLEGGGALGLAHVGVLRWFQQHHIPVDDVAGTSMGGLVGVLYSTGMSGDEIQDFFRGIMTTALEEDELLIEVRLPILPADTRFGFYEFNRRAGDFALGMALVTFRLQDGVIREPRVALGGIESQPRRIAEAEQQLAGRSAERAAFEAAAAAVASVVDPLEDAVTSATYRRDLSRTVTRRALERAAA